MSYEKIAFIASDAEEAVAAELRLVERYGRVEPEDADVIVALGGDGLMLQALHRFMNSGKPIYGMNRGSVGFLMNEFAETSLAERLEKAELTEIHPLHMTVTGADGKTSKALAINEVSLLRQSFQAAKLRISIDGKVRMEELICDGILLATPAGSTAYNLSAHGTILPIGSPLLVLTPISAFRPRRWRGALLSHEARVRIEVLEAPKRPVSAVADHTEFRGIVAVEIAEADRQTAHILFDEGHNLDERVLREQFSY